ncbi:3' exoribonuclease family, domain 1 containing protein [Tritrichomonas foetus]|uniref:3' exoribonuclease family, domain 1 containing protein n=1 Tax=Tritrichomonas foetus TaxID=1144522 RepID=A0A1J4K4T2_9EUKA|nr:3' exoribonuclease family, domain 1 containing protein [Tritrichomonas foetus]|eukprot:OHT04724.1 3' exoribonuclease family, domain 1 containing protein [Tritrichomonas foetus]
MDVYNEFTGLRAEGRRPNEMRIIDAKIGTIPGCTGSSHFKMGQTEVIAQIFGPSEGKGGDRETAEIIVSLEFADFAKAPHSTDTARTRRSRESELIIKKTFEEAIKREMYPGSKIEIAITVIQDDGGCQSAAINAVTLALIDAGIPMIDFVVSLSSAFIADQVFLDTGRAESSSRFPILELAVFPSTSEIVSMNMTARISPENAKKLTELALDGCRKLHALLAAIVRAAPSGI